MEAGLSAPFALSGLDISVGLSALEFERETTAPARRGLSARLHWAMF